VFFPLFSAKSFRLSPLFCKFCRLPPPSSPNLINFLYPLSPLSSSVFSFSLSLLFENARLQLKSLFYLETMQCLECVIQDEKKEYKILKILVQTLTVFKSFLWIHKAFCV
jgi:hypothetical protein